GSGKAARYDRRVAGAIDAVERSDGLTLGSVIHAADEERTIGTHLTVVEAGGLRLVVAGPEIAASARFRIEHDHLSGKRGNQRSALAKSEGRHPLLEGPASA